MRVLLTGIGGFVGSACLDYFLEYTDWNIIGIDAFRKKGSLSRVQNSNRLKIYNHDLSVPIDEVLENQICERNLDGKSSPIDIIFNIASDSAVERSISDPVSCLRNNFELGLNVLEFARRINPKLFVVFSTDEVYGEASDKPHKEWDALVPSNPYASSKGSQELMSIAYWRSYDLPVIICNTMNIIGIRQDKEKFLAKLIWKIATDQIMEIYGEPGKIGSRFYIDARNVADALIFLSKIKPASYQDGASRPDRYNIVGDMELDNLEMAQLVASCMGKSLKYKLVPSQSARSGYDRRYALDGSKLASMGWKPPFSTKDSVQSVVDWSLENPHWIV